MISGKQARSSSVATTKSSINIIRNNSVRDANDRKEASYKVEAFLATPREPLTHFFKLAEANYTDKEEQERLQGKDVRKKIQKENTEVGPKDEKETQSKVTQEKPQRRIRFFFVKIDGIRIGM